MRSNNPIIKRLNILLPNASPAARSAPPDPPMDNTELIPVANSGKEVAVASKTTPTKDLPKPVLKAMISAFFVSCVADIRIVDARAARRTHNKGNGKLSKIKSPSEKSLTLGQEN